MSSSLEKNEKNKESINNQQLACRIPGHTLQKINKGRTTSTEKNAWQLETVSCPWHLKPLGTLQPKCLDYYRTWSVKQQRLSSQSIPFSRLLSYWKRQESTTLQRENALFILNTSANILSSTYRYNPVDGANCEDALVESVHHEE